ncbi:MAG: PAS domain S-box protein [Oscillospiraceae bacterium]|nr:PAS domain S-box protein [Oscillospiraceae bacterium]
MRRRIFGGMCGTALLAVLLSAVLFSLACYQRLYEQMKQDTRKEAGYIIAVVEDSGSGWMERLAPVTDARLTHIAADGSVLYDSEGAAGQFENHAGRAEVRAALSGGVGESARLSGTLGEQTYYYAVRLSDGTVLRVSNTIGSVYAILLGGVPLLVLIVLAAVLTAAVLAGRQAQRIVQPINALDLEEPAANLGAYDELSPLLGRMAAQNGQIKNQMEALHRQQEELAAITANMREGLVVLSAGAKVLSMNRSAREILGAGAESVTGHSIFAYCRTREFLEVAERALAGQSGSTEIEKEGRTYRLMASPVEEGGGEGGCILLLVDITEGHSAERLRREFSANVSHELKTPLTSISGYAELLCNGMVKQEDVPRFAERIYQEANRLIALVQDIIKLSQLDEGAAELEKEPVELLALAERVAERLGDSAAERQVTVTVTGKRRTVQGVPALLDELLYNLCENAVRYNRPGGKVTVTVDERGGRTEVTVADTGVGIPENDRERVFERFYRVDAGRSKGSGGTGLGLSIVKHAAQCHGAAVSLQSAEGEGTTVTVTFPAE